MSILDLTEHPAWYAVRVAETRYGSSGALGIRYSWAPAKFLNNTDALNYVIDRNPHSSTRGGITSFYEADLFQWDGSHWTKVA